MEQQPSFMSCLSQGHKTFPHRAWEMFLAVKATLPPMSETRLTFAKLLGESCWVFLLPRIAKSLELFQRLSPGDGGSGGALGLAPGHSRCLPAAERQSANRMTSQPRDLRICRPWRCHPRSLTPVRCTELRSEGCTRPKGNTLQTVNRE